jgi:hypothetical protein
MRATSKRPVKQGYSANESESGNVGLVDRWLVLPVKKMPSHFVAIIAGQVKGLASGPRHERSTGPEIPKRGQGRIDFLGGEFCYAASSFCLSAISMRTRSLALSIPRAFLFLSICWMIICAIS